MSYDDNSSFMSLDSTSDSNKVKYFTQKGTTNQKILLDSEFISWLSANISLCINISPSQSDVNICQNCMNEYCGKIKVCIHVKYCTYKLCTLC